MRVPSELSDGYEPHGHIPLYLGPRAAILVLAGWGRGVPGVVGDWWVVWEGYTGYPTSHPRDPYLDIF